MKELSKWHNAAKRRDLRKRGACLKIMRLAVEHNENIVEKMTEVECCRSSVRSK